MDDVIAHLIERHYNNIIFILREENIVSLDVYNGQNLYVVFDCKKLEYRRQEINKGMFIDIFLLPTYDPTFFIDKKKASLGKDIFQRSKKEIWVDIIYLLSILNSYISIETNFILQFLIPQLTEVLIYMKSSGRYILENEKDKQFKIALYPDEINISSKGVNEIIKEKMNKYDSKEISKQFTEEEIKNLKNDYKIYWSDKNFTQGNFANAFNLNGSNFSAFLSGKKYCLKCLYALYIWKEDFKYIHIPYSAHNNKSQK